MPRPKPIYFDKVKLYYKAVKSPSGTYLLAPTRKPPGTHCGLAALAKEPQQVWVGDERHTRVRVLYALAHCCDVDELTTITPELEAVPYGRVPGIKSNNTKKAKPHNFEGTPMAGVYWNEAKRNWSAFNGDHKFIGYFKDYHEACNERMKAVGYKAVSTRESKIYPAPKLAYFAMFKGRKVPRGYRSWITYDKHQEYFRVHLDGKTVQLFKTLSEAIQEVDKWKA